MPFRWIVLDAVGTVIFPHPEVSTAYRDIGRRFGSRLNSDDVRTRFVAAFAELESADRESPTGMLTNEDREVRRWRRIVDVVLDDTLDPQGCFDELWEHFGRPQSWKCFDDVEPALSHLNARGYNLAIASNFDRRLYSVIDGLPALTRIERTFVSSVVGYRKPSSRFYESVVSGLDCSPTEILVVGDTEENDVTAPRNAGLTAIHLQRDREHGRLETERQSSGLPSSIGSLNELTEALP